uniref:Uncharacterized protein n=1 Tax=Kalanchoe fedtschenkoi TaxID=63787 RepID=A0A7N0TGW6_KALFE
MALIVLPLLLLIAQSVHGGDDTYELKEHVEFFDQNHDGILYISETVEGFKQLGIGAAESLASATAIHTALSAKTRPGQPFDKDFPIIIENIKLAKHTSDSGVYDDEGRFVPEKFEAIFTNHAHIKPDALNSDEVDELLKSNRKAGDFKNWLAAEGEWKLLYKLGKDADGFLSKENIRNVYDGSFFYQLAKPHNTTAAA